MKTLYAKILIGFSIILALLMASSGISYFMVNGFNKDVQQMVSYEFELYSVDVQLSNNLIKRGSLVRGYLLTGENSYIDEFNKITEESVDIQNKVIELSNSKNIEEIVEGSIEWRKFINDKVIPAYDSGHNDKALRLYFEGEEKIQPIIDYLNELTIGREENINKLSEELTNSGDNLQLIIIVSSIIAVILGILTALFLGKQITKPIINVVNRVEKIAEGDLTGEKLVAKTKDEIGRLVNSVNTMAANLKDLVQKVNTSSNDVASSSEQLSASADQSTKVAEQTSQLAQQSSEGADQQLQSVSSVSSSMQQLTSRVQQISRNSEEMNELTQRTSETTKEGSESVKDVVKQMNEINATVSETSSIIKVLGQRSEEISKIVEMITNIAEQTNLLSLNAAIEAARAGEADKGFAVVADEVRKLADESKKSSDNISNMIRDIQAETSKALTSMDFGTEKVTNGLKLTEKANKSFKEIEEAILQVTNKVIEVTSSIGEITTVSEDILSQVDNVKNLAEKSAASSQENSAASEEQLATMEEISSSAQALSSLADELKSVITKFKL